jgi:diguanylate cyclase (GGDEF)-like protein/PAS domain S-box-containing protein
MKKAGTDKGTVVVEPSAAEKAVQEVEQRYLGLLEISGEAIMIVCESTIVFASAAASALLGFETAEQLVGRHYLDFIRPKYRDAVTERINGLTLKGQTAPFIHRKLIRADGKIAEVEVALHACGFKGKLAVQILMRDVTEQRRLQAEVTRLAQYDSLTELANRSQFRDRLDGAIARAARNKQMLGVVCIGVDHFRAINDALGQHGGDVVLMQIAERLKRIVRKSDSVARLGGDEFAVILEGLIEKNGAGIAAQRKLASLAEPFMLEDKEIRLTVSIGVAIYPLDAQDLDSLLRQAIVAMHYAKQHGRNNFQFYSEELDTLGRGKTQRRGEIRQRLESLTPREREVLDLLIAGKASKMIAYVLGISARTIDIHRARVMEKMQADSLAELVHMMRELQS